MPSYKIHVARICWGGNQRHEQFDWAIELATQSLTRGDIDLTTRPYQDFQADVARNCAAFDAMDIGADVVFMIDADAGPPMMTENGPGFFSRAIDFLMAHQGPAAIFAPFAAADGHPMVFMWESDDVLVTTTTGEDLNKFRLRRVTKNEMAHLQGRGIMPIADSGCTLVAYRVDAFRLVKPPFFFFTNSADGRQMKGGEDSNCHQKLAAGGVKLYMDADRWCDHWKTVAMPRPMALNREHIDRRYLESAIGAIKSGGYKIRHVSKIEEPKAGGDS